MREFVFNRTADIVALALTIALTLVTTGSVRAGRAVHSSGNTQRVSAKAATVDPQADRIISRYAQALGGEAAVRSIHSFSMTGTVELPTQGMTGTVQAFAKAPNRYVITFQLAGIGQIKQGFDGSTGWAQDGISGSRQLSGSELAQARREANLYHDIELKRLYTTIKFQGDDKVDGKSVHVLVATPPEGGTEKLYFDAQTGLLFRQDMTVDSPQGQFPVQSYTEDYRSVGATKFPFVLRQVTSVATFVVKFSEIKTNVAVEDSVFAKP